jgi:DNA-binding transcriptional LysR family regulator
MNIRWVVLFAAVGQDKSFTRAAGRLNLAQPWLSAQIRKLETELGVQLFVRSKSRVELTPQGEKLLPIAVQVAETVQRFRELAKKMDGDRALVVRLGTHAATLGTPELAQLNDEFRSVSTSFSLEIENGMTAELLQRLREGHLDIALLLAPFDSRGLETILLREIYPYLLFPRTAGWPSDGMISLEALEGHTIGVVPRHVHPEFYDQAFEPLRRQGIHLRPVPEPDGRAMEHFVRIRHIPVLMLEGDPSDYDASPDLATASVIPFPAAARQYLAKLSSGVDARAVDRYWSSVRATVGREPAAAFPTPLTL